MTEQLTLTAEEKHLIADLLEAERKDVISEIHHASSSESRAEMRRRLELVKSLQLRVAPAEPVAGG